MDLAHKKRVTITPERHRRIIEDLSGGDWPSMIALRNGVAPDTMMAWVLKGLDQDAPEEFREFADDFVRTEAEISGKLVAIILAGALGVKKGDVDPADEWERRPCVEDAKWLLLVRFQFLWRVQKNGKMGGESAAEVVCRKIEEIQSEERDKVREILSQLPEVAKRAARQGGFLVP